MVIDAVGQAVHSTIALQEPSVDREIVFVRVPDDKGVDGDSRVTESERRCRGEFLLPRNDDRDGGLVDFFEVEFVGVQKLLEMRATRVTISHGIRGLRRDQSL